MNRRSATIAAIALALMAGGAASLVRMRAIQKLGRPGVKLVDHGGTNGVVVALPEHVLNFASKEFEVTEQERAVLPKDTTYGKRLYAAPDNAMPDGFFVVFTQVVLMGTDRTSIHRPEFCLTGQGWTIDSKEMITVPMGRPRPYELPAQLFTATKRFKSPDGSVETKRGLYLFWFVADDALTASHWARQWSMGRELLTTGKLQRWAYVSLLTVCRPGQEADALARLKQFIGAAVPEFQTTTGAPDAPSPRAAAEKMLNDPVTGTIN